MGISHPHSEKTSVFSIDISQPGMIQELPFFSEFSYGMGPFICHRNSDMAAVRPLEGKEICSEFLLREFNFRIYFYQPHYIYFKYTKYIFILVTHNFVFVFV